MFARRDIAAAVLLGAACVLTLVLRIPNWWVFVIAVPGIGGVVLAAAIGEAASSAERAQSAAPDRSRPGAD